MNPFSFNDRIIVFLCLFFHSPDQYFFSHLFIIFKIYNFIFLLTEDMNYLLLESMKKSNSLDILQHKDFLQKNQYQIKMQAHLNHN